MDDDSETTDEEIVEELRGGDEGAATRLFDRYFPLLRARVRARLPARLRQKVAESDVIQEAYLGAIRRLADFQDRGEGSFGAWLRTIVDRRVADQMRKFLGTDKRDVNREVSQIEQKLGAAGDDSVSEPLRREEALVGVLEVVEQLPPPDRMVIKLVHFEGQTIAEAAELMGSTTDATRMRYGRALVRLQRLMQDAGDAPGATEGGHDGT